MTIALVLTSKEQHLIEYIRAMGYGTLRLVVVDKQPDLIEEPVKKVKL